MMLHMQPLFGESPAALFAERARLVAELEQAGVEAVWVTEHHFDPQSVSSAPLLLLAHWAAMTTRIQLGVAAVLPAGRDPVLLAEEVALLSQLAPGRLALGFAKGGPFEAQKLAFGWGREEARGAMRDVVQGMRDALTGQRAEQDDGALPPIQPPVHTLPPMFVASRDADTLAWAARQGLGWMAAQFWPLEVYDAQAAVWMQAAQGGAPDALLSRGLWIADDADAARDHALRWLIDFRDRKQGQWRVGFRGPMADMSEQDAVSRMIVGSPRECAEQLRVLLDGRCVPRLAFNPMHADPPVQLAQMRRLLREVWPSVIPAAAPDRACA